ncbi:MAG: RsmB/NOP family class I SAM-dependent RNA methyltransferase [Coxiellaceae bacterium]|nr:RsmB/NOP family class I SAM-dependent RNA methyltransferase [Coxiellaceae bacterium]
MSTDTLPEIYQYYADIIPDLDQASEVLSQPLPTTLWLNPIKTNAEDFVALMQQDGYGLEPIAWHANAFRYFGEKSIAKSWAYAAGLFQIQEEVSMLAGDLLAAKAGERVLDCCAAPGNKTAQIAIQMQNQGTVIANDINYGRMRAFGQITKRLGLINVSTTINDASSLPNVGEFFDRVLADVPCSCEGTFRKNDNKASLHTSEQSAVAMSKRQKDILMKAVKLCKPGGRIVYSTCTFSPIENEAVVSAVLTAMGDALRVVPVTIEHLNTANGLTQWQGQVFDPQLKQAIRLWPHQNNTGGFFIVVLEKLHTTNRRPFELAPLPDDALHDYHNDVIERFGLPENITEQFRFARLSNKGLYCINRDNQPPARMNIDATGLFCLKTSIQFPKLSTAAAMLIGHLAARHVVHVDIKQRDAYLAKEDIELGESQVSADFTTGYVVVIYQNTALGLGLYFSPNDQHQHVMRSLYRATLI